MPLPECQWRCLSAGRSLEPQEKGDNGWYSSGGGNKNNTLAFSTLMFSGVGVAWYLQDRRRRRRRRRTDEEEKCHQLSLVPLLQLNAASDTGGGSGSREAKKVSVRERRYNDFCSIQHRGEPYMTPRDFLESVTIDEPRGGVGWGGWWRVCSWSRSLLMNPEVGWGGWG